ncbi:hypothetical protein [Streptomyces sp. SCSIO ZS0520]|uniref:hypothetical protein n=1 Tax=Streptomyces sp. SCSIO ZS0520 TaxID=2892996 RepID=UPI0021DA6B67|nr:hypothetical protein [Streptomyces sp. SCSIO ZS0520]
MLVVLAVLDAMQARLCDGGYFEWPAELLGVVGDDDLEAVGLGLGVQLDVLRARSALELVDVNDFMCLQQDAHDLGHGAGHVLVEQQFQATTCRGSLLP